MYAVKGGWVGQTFALAKCNESEGRKSRIRRSKEERKTLVESFIKKYQSSNNGEFPSMSLTQKEVGGSYYTVREIVREVIQENRVLGPPKSTPEEQQLQNADNFSEQYPLGSISYEPQIFLSSPNGTNFVSDHPSTDGEMVSATNEHSNGNEDQCLTNGQIIRGSQIDMEGENASDLSCIENRVSELSEPTLSFEGETVESNMKVNLLVSEPSYAKESLEEKLDSSDAKPSLLVSEPLDGKESVEEEAIASEAKASLLVTEPSEAKVGLLVSKSSDAKESVGEEIVASEAKATPPVNKPSEPKENVENELAASKAKLDPILTDVFVETFPVRLVTESTDSLELRSRGDSSLSSDDNNGLVGKNNADKNEDVLLETSNASIDIVHQHGIVAEVEAMKAPNGSPTNYPNINNESIFKEETKTVVSDHRAEAQSCDDAQKEGSPSLDRINPKSREEPSRTREKNPLVSILKSFVAAFMKLWSD